MAGQSDSPESERDRQDVFGGQDPGPEDELGPEPAPGRDELGGPDLGPEDELGPEPAPGRDELGGPDPGPEDELGGPDPD